MGLLAGVCAFLYSFIRNYLRSNTGFAIGFTGPDGVGKTMVIEQLIARFGDVFRTAHSYMHFRPMLFGNLGEVAHSAGLKKEVDREYTKPHRGGRVGVVSSLVRLAYYSVDYIVGYWLKVKSQIRITRLVIFDRYYTDVICDSRRSRIFLNYKFLYWFGWVFVPRLDYNVLLTARTETILARKRELTEEGIRAINERIEFLATKRGYRRFVNEGTAEEMVTEILEWVFEEQHKRNMKRIV
jgi:thymidylate kinase